MKGGAVVGVRVAGAVDTCPESVWDPTWTGQLALRTCPEEKPVS